MAIFRSKGFSKSRAEYSGNNIRENRARVLPFAQELEKLERKGVRFPGEKFHLSGKGEGIIFRGNYLGGFRGPGPCHNFALVLALKVSEDHPRNSGRAA